MRKGYKIDKETGELVPREKKKSENRLRTPSMTSIKNKRLLPVWEYCQKEGLSLTALSELCGLAKATVPTRIREGDCSLSDMEEMAEAAGYKFVWHWEKV